MCVFLLLAVGSLLPVPPIFYQRYISPTNKTEAQQNSQELYEIWWRAKCRRIDMAYNLRSNSKEPENPLFKDQSTPSLYRPVVDQTGFGFFSLLPQTPAVCLDFSSFLKSSPITSTIVAPTDTTHSVPHPLSSTFNTIVHLSLHSQRRQR